MDNTTVHMVFAKAKDNMLYKYLNRKEEKEMQKLSEQQKKTIRKALLPAILIMALVTTGVIAYILVQRTASYTTAVTISGIMNIKMCDWNPHNGFASTYDDLIESNLFYDDYVSVSTPQVINIDTIESLPDQRVITVFRLKDDYNSPQIFLQANIGDNNDMQIDTVTGYLCRVYLENEGNIHYAYVDTYTAKTISTTSKTLIATETELLEWSHEDITYGEPGFGITKDSTFNYYMVVVEFTPSEVTYTPDPDILETETIVEQLLEINFEFRDA